MVIYRHVSRKVALILNANEGEAHHLLEAGQVACQFSLEPFGLGGESAPLLSEGV